MFSFSLILFCLFWNELFCFLSKVVFIFSYDLMTCMLLIFYSIFIADDVLWFLCEKIEKPLLFSTIIHRLNYSIVYFWRFLISINQIIGFIFEIKDKVIEINRIVISNQRFEYPKFRSLKSKIKFLTILRLVFSRFKVLRV